MPEIYVPNQQRRLVERAAEDWAVFMYDGLGIMVSDDQLNMRQTFGRPGPRQAQKGEPKVLFVSGGQRGGKTVGLAGLHLEACLYKTGVDNTDGRYWRNYLFKTLAGAPTTDLDLKLWQAIDEIQKGASEAQWDRRSRRARGGAFLHMFTAGKMGDWPVVRFDNGSRIDFRSFEGYAYRVEGDQWWLITWDEWASQPDREIETVKTDVLMGRARDHDAKIILAAWPKAETERHLIAALRNIETGADVDSKVVYLDSENAPWTNRNSLKAERRVKSQAQWLRTVKGRPAGGASIEFAADVVANMIKPDLPFPQLPEEGFRYFSSWDIGMAHDSTVGLTWRIPLAGVSPLSKARIVNATEIKGGETVTLDQLTYAISREQMLYHSQSAVDATSMGGVAAARQLRGLNPRVLAFVARSNDRIYGNIRLAAITNALDLVSWGRPTDERAQVDPVPWGMVEAPRIVALVDQLANFDRDAKNVPDDWVWAFNIGLWYIKKYYLVSLGSYRPIPFDVAAGPTQPQRRQAISFRS